MGTHTAIPATEENITDVVALEEKEALASRILDSPSFQPSRKSQQLLQHIVTSTLRDAYDECSEQQIGIQVFGRSPGYNAAEDSIVRSQVRLLRQRLETYFEQEGKNETLHLEIPRGHYVAVFRPVIPVPPEAVAQPEKETPSNTSASSRTVIPANLADRTYSPGYIALCAGIVLALLAGVALGHRLSRGEDSAASATPPLWSFFLSPPSPPLVIYSNAVFVGNGTEGLHYATGSEPASSPIMDHYTGIGEVASIYSLTRFFDQRQKSFTLKRSRLVTWDDARSRNLIFVGAPLENPSLLIIPDSKDFTFVRDGAAFDIENLRPLPGEPQWMKHGSWPMTVDYAIISLRPGFEPGTRMLVFSGMTTIGTQAAVEFACSPSGAADLLSLEQSRKGGYFEAVLMISVNSGVPVSSHIIAMHRS